MHKRVKLWLQLNPRYKAIVNKMEVVKEEIAVRDMMEELRNMVKYF